MNSTSYTTHDNATRSPASPGPATASAAAAPVPASRRWARPWVLRLLAVALAICWLALIAATWAEADAAAAEPTTVGDAGGSGSGDEYSFKWLDPEKKIYVLQNRRYLKAGRPELSVLAGPTFANSFNKSFNIEPRFTFYFTEDLGIELFYINSSNSPTNTLDALVAAHPGNYPLIREIQSQYGATLQWVPWYAKMNFFNKILYFDWYLGAGAGQMKTQLDTLNASGAVSGSTPQDLFAAYINTGHQYHLTDAIKLRLDVTAVVYKAPVYGTSGDDSWYSNFNFGIGLGIRL